MTVAFAYHSCKKKNSNLSPRHGLKEVCFRDGLVFLVTFWEKMYLIVLLHVATGNHIFVRVSMKLGVVSVKTLPTISYEKAIKIDLKCDEA